MDRHQYTCEALNRSASLLDVKILVKFGWEVILKLPHLLRPKRTWFVSNFYP